MHLLQNGFVASFAFNAMFAYLTDLLFIRSASVK
jgi:hypothetical protein